MCKEQGHRNNNLIKEAMGKDEYPVMCIRRLHINVQQPHGPMTHTMVMCSHQPDGEERKQHGQYTVKVIKTLDKKYIAKNGLSCKSYLVISLSYQLSLYN